MPTVELVYHGGCPNVPEVRARMLQAFARSAVEPRWREWRIDEADSPARVRGYGSPTVLIDGRDIAAGEAVAGASCRLYPQRDGSVGGAPSVAAIATALGGAGSGSRGRWRLNLAVLPGIGAAFLPKVACPACWPAYAGALSSIGLGFLLEASYLLPLTAGFLLVALAALAFRARRRRGYGPLALGLVASVVVLAGKFRFESDPAMYVGLAILIAASLWNSWPRPLPSAACPPGWRQRPGVNHE